MYSEHPTIFRDLIYQMLYYSFTQDAPRLELRRSTVLDRRCVPLTLIGQIFCSSVLLLAATAPADPPPGYYDSVDASSQEALRQTIHDVIDHIDHINQLPNTIVHKNRKS